MIPFPQDGNRASFLCSLQPGCSNSLLHRERLRPLRLCGNPFDVDADDFGAVEGLFYGEFAVGDLVGRKFLDKEAEGLMPFFGGEADVRLSLDYQTLVEGREPFGPRQYVADDAEGDGGIMRNGPQFLPFLRTMDVNGTLAVPDEIQRHAVSLSALVHHRKHSVSGSCQQLLRPIHLQKPVLATDGAVVV